MFGGGPPAQKMYWDVGPRVSKPQVPENKIACEERRPPSTSETKAYDYFARYTRTGDPSRSGEKCVESSSGTSSSPNEWYSGSPTESAKSALDPVTAVFTREEYAKVIRDRRAEFVNRNFGPILAATFKALREDANHSKQCHREVIFEVPDHFDLDRVEAMLCSYFSDLGYKPLTEPRKTDNVIARDGVSISRVTITLT